MLNIQYDMLGDSADVKRSNGQYYTHGNPFMLKVFNNWAESINLRNRKVLEPFAGANYIIKALQKNGWAKDFSSYDIDPQSPDVQKNDSLKNFPQNYDVIVTNPPWLAKNSAKRRNLPYPDCEFDDLYKHCLDKSLQNAKYVAALIPASYLRTNLFMNRLHTYISLHDRGMFCDTDNPVALALFKPEDEISGGAEIYHDDKYIGNLQNLKKYLPKSDKKIAIRFNDPEGQLGFIAFDNTRAPSIRFCLADELKKYDISHSTRMITRINIDYHASINKFVEILNKEIEYFRNSTSDVFLTPFKGLRQDGNYRRRMDFSLARKMIQCHA